MNQRISGTLAIGVGENGQGRIGQDADGPLEDGPAVHREVMEALFEDRRRRRDATAARRPAQKVAARAVGAELVGDQSLVFLARREQDGAGPVAEEREALLVAGIDHPAIAISADHQRTLAIARRHELRRDDEGEDEARAGRLHVEGGAGQLEPVLNQVGRGGECHVGREGGDDQEVDVGRLAPGRLQAADRGLRAQVACRLVGQRESPLMNSRPVDDPFRIESVRLAQVLIGHDQLGDVAPGTENPHAQERARWRREMDLAVAHERYATDFIRDV